MQVIDGGVAGLIGLGPSRAHIDAARLVSNDVGDALDTATHAVSIGVLIEWLRKALLDK
jgi:hypothetical protein